MKLQNKAAKSGSSLATCSPSSVKAVMWKDFPEAVETLKPGETLELHHPEAKGQPTPMNHCTHTRADGKVLHMWAGLWAVKDGTAVWTYCGLSLDLPENAEVSQGDRERKPDTQSTHKQP